jgi:hypothetical protein
MSSSKLSRKYDSGCSSDPDFLSIPDPRFRGSKRIRIRNTGCLFLIGYYICFRYLNDIDYDVQYGGLGVTPLPLHGQVRPIKVEQQEQGEGGWGADTALSTTPPILRRRARKREADDSEVRPWIIFPEMHTQPSVAIK